MQKRLLIILFQFLLYPAILFSQSELKSDLDSLRRVRAELANLQNKQLEYMQIIDSLAIRINQLKSAQSLNFFQRRRLENLLREVQKSSNNLSVLEKEISYARAREDKWEKLINEKKQATSFDSFQLLEIKETLTHEQKQNAIQTFKNLQETQRKINKDELKTFRHIKIPRIQIEPEDTPRQIERKADLIKDSEDKIREQADLIGRKIKRGEQALELRQRMGDLLADIAVFEHRDEPSSAGEKKNLSDRFSLDASDGLRSNLADKSITQGIPTAYSVEDIMQVDFGGLSSADMESAIQILQEMHDHYIASADSLKEKAEKFYQTAQDRRYGKKPK